LKTESPEAFARRRIERKGKKKREREREITHTKSIKTYAKKIASRNPYI